MEKVESKKPRMTKEKTPQEKLVTKPYEGKGAKMTYLGKDGKKYPNAKAKALADRKYEEHVGSKKRAGEFVKDPEMRITKGEALKKAKRAHPGKQLRWDGSKYVPVGQ